MPNSSDQVPVGVAIVLITLSIIIAIVFYLAGKISLKNPQGTSSERNPTACIQVITSAKNSQTHECKDFPTPCDVPEGWMKVLGC